MPSNAFRHVLISWRKRQLLIHQRLKRFCAAFSEARRIAWHSLCVSDARADKMLKRTARPIYSSLGELS
jgi:hypothetical protein